MVVEWRVYLGIKYKTTFEGGKGVKYEPDYGDFGNLHGFV